VLVASAPDFTFHADLGLGSQETFRLDRLEVTWNVFQAWKQFQQNGDRDALQQRVAAIKTQMRPLLEWGSTGKRHRHVRALAKNLLKLWPALWTFADVPDVEAAERGLRAAVIYRKLSLGSRSQGGERTIERLLSVDQTCRLQRRSLYSYLADALTARARGDPLPVPMRARCALHRPGSRSGLLAGLYMTSMIGKRVSPSRQAAAKSAVPTSPVKSE
jgi:hypothetical protein